MGETSTKINHDGNGHHRVTELRQEIVRKREQISVELDELRRRRADMIIRAQEGAKVAAGGAVGLLIVSSLFRAVRDLFRDEDDIEVASVEHEQERGSISAAIIGMIGSMIISEIRSYAMSYAKEQVRAKLQERERTAA